MHLDDIIKQQACSFGTFCCSNITIVFQDFGSKNHHNFVFWSSEIFMFELITELCSIHKEDSNSTFLLKNFHENTYEPNFEPYFYYKTANISE